MVFQFYLHIKYVLLSLLLPFACHLTHVNKTFVCHTKTKKWKRSRTVRKHQTPTHHKRRGVGNIADGLSTVRAEILRHEYLCFDQYQICGVLLLLLLKFESGCVNRTSEKKMPVSDTQASSTLYSPQTDYLSRGEGGLVLGVRNCC